MPPALCTPRLFLRMSSLLCFLVPTRPKVPYTLEIFRLPPMCPPHPFRTLRRAYVSYPLKPRSSFDIFPTAHLLDLSTPNPAVPVQLPLYTFSQHLNGIPSRPLAVGRDRLSTITTVEFPRVNEYANDDGKSRETLGPPSLGTAHLVLEQRLSASQLKLCWTRGMYSCHACLYDFYYSPAWHASTPWGRHRTNRQVHRPCSSAG